VGAAPWGIALAPDRRAYVTTAQGIAVVDTKTQTRLALIPYQSPVGAVSYGEYRPGGMGIAVSPDGKRVYAGVYLPGQTNRLEIIDTEKLTTIASVPIGIRPFEVLTSRDGREVYALDHDSFTITVIDPLKLRERTLEVAPLGRGAFDKPHYAALNPANGHLLLPVQGRVLLDFDPTNQTSSTLPLKSNTHQHGVALSADGNQLFIVGTGPAGSATGGPNLAIVNLTTKTEEIIPLSRPHEKVALSQDGSEAYLSGGYTFADGGWDGMTVIDLKSRAIREIIVPERPLDLKLLS
jgi:DNA-binding beta-propeller fold protein YncE